MSALEHISSQAIGEASADADVRKLKEMAMDSLKGAALPDDIDLSRLVDRSNVGRFAVLHATGNIITTSLLFRSHMESMAKMIMEDLRNPKISKTAKDKALLMEAMNKTISNHAQLSLVELKIAEAESHGHKKKKRSSLAPQINTTNTYVMVKEEPKEVAVIPPEKDDIEQ